ncbi:MAG: hypothetical protein ABII76_09790 [Pseudomonadota bacterium]
MHLHDLETSWRVWTWLEATGWKWPPSVLLEQPEALLDDLLAISSTDAAVKAMRDRDKG